MTRAGRLSCPAVSGDVGPEQDAHAVACPLGYLGRVDSGVEPRGQARVPEARRLTPAGPYSRPHMLTADDAFIHILSDHAQQGHFWMVGVRVNPGGMVAFSSAMFAGVGGRNP